DARVCFFFSHGSLLPIKIGSEPRVGNKGKRARRAGGALGARGKLQDQPTPTQQKEDASQGCYGSENLHSRKAQGVQGSGKDQNTQQEKKGAGADVGAGCLAVKGEGQQGQGVDKMVENSRVPYREHFRGQPRLEGMRSEGAQSHPQESAHARYFNPVHPQKVASCGPG